MTKTTAKVKTAPKAKAKNSVSRTKGQAKPRSLTDIKKQNEDDDILAALDEESTATADAILADIDAPETVDKSAIYEEQESSLTVDDTEKTKPAKKTKRVRKTADGEQVLRAKREVDMAKLGEIYEDPIAKINEIESLPMKVRDKARNAFLAMTTSSRLSQYTGYAVAALNTAHDGVIEVGTLRNILESRGYKQGTANAQAQQQMALLPFLGIAERNGRLLTKVDGDAFTALAKLV